MSKCSDINRLLDSLSNSKFRGSFHLNNKMKDYVMKNGLDKISKDAYEILESRVASSNPKNDGKQTPMKQTHPVFIAQHATGTCCRGCIERIHHIPKGRELSSIEVKYLVNVIMFWIQREVS